MRRMGRVLAALLLAPAVAVAAEPLSAIPWLSRSLETPEKASVFSDPPGTAPGEFAPAASEERTITVTPLGDVSRDAAGLLPPERTGFKADLWGETPAERVRELILAQPLTGVPEARALFLRLLLAEAVPPRGADAEAGLLIARLDRLLEIGALEEAETLMARAGPDTTELFRRWFDTGLLLERAEAPCAALRDNPQLSPTLPARVFCLARAGDWNAAEITLTLGENVGSIAPEQQQLLARFLDPEIFEGEPPPPIAEPLTGLDFMMREAVGLPRPRGALPLAFLHSDVSARAPMRVRIGAAERLVLSGAVPPPVLFAAYRAGEPAASGGVWDRAAVVQTLDARLDKGPAARIGPALRAADAALYARGVRTAFAQEYAPKLAEIETAALDAPARRVLVELLLLGGKTEAARRAAGPDPEPEVERLLAIADPAAPAPPLEGASDLARAALAGLAGGAPEGPRQSRLAEALADGRQGEAMLLALDLLSAGIGVDPSALRDALFALERAGQGLCARRIALQTLLLGGG